MGAKFTPGPWIARQEGRGRHEQWHVGINGYLSTICKVNCVSVSRVEASHTHEHSPTALSLLMEAEEKANAHLIAAAPEMYEALEVVYRALYEHAPGAFFNTVGATIEAALAKARGEQS